MMNVWAKPYEDLNIDELYAIIALRSAVFVVEQNCVYQDLDYKDQQAIHIMGLINNELVAYTRIFAPGNYFDQASIGRVIVAEAHRGQKLGHEIMERSIKTIIDQYQTTQIDISAQTHLEQFYNSHGFYSSGTEYLEDGIPHKKMIKRIKTQ